MITPAAALLERAVGWRQGVVSRLHPVPRTLSDVDVPGFAAVPEPFATGGTSGGAAFEPEQAKRAALAEAVERYSAARSPLETVSEPEGRCWRLDDFSLHTPEQRARPDFPYRYADTGYAKAWTLPGNEPVWVPAGLVGLRDLGLPATSSGLAAGPSAVNALLRATQELVERDAFTTTWLHSLAPPPLALPDELRAGDARAFDLTPAYSPHPVVAVAGTLPLAGRPRPTLGLACRATVGEAIRKAWLEWTQGTVFIAARSTTRVHRRDEVTDFDRHALYYAGHWDEWRALPWWRGEPGPPPRDSAARGDAAQLRELVDALGVRLAYRELTTPEAAAVGLRCVRVLSPDLTPLHADHRWPHLGGRAADVAWRYPGRSGRFPNPAPHPLG
ncbi:YcaO-like family protein [Saccharothrix saharensis]|uniref:YcaO-like family protein n=1 Tax=Saccharothrix saharensis TaxID=571190 RepID=UPI0036BC4CFC